MSTRPHEQLPVLAGKYRLDSLLGEGGMGQVFLATNLLLGREVAIKILRKEFSINLSAREKFVAEARTANTVRHPHVVDVLDVVADDECPYIVQELLIGQTLADRVHALGKLSVADTLELIVPVVAAMAHAHERGVLHRDLKPENIFLTESEGVLIPKIVDFGLSQLYREVSIEDSSSVIAGTPAYMAPEVIHAEQNVDPSSDVWSLGVVLYECVTGRLPYRSESVHSVLAEISSGNLRPLSDAMPGLPPQFVAIVDKCLKHKQRERYANGRELLAAVEALRQSFRDSQKPQVRVQRKSTLAPGVLTATEVRAGIENAMNSSAGAFASPDTSQNIAIRPVALARSSSPAREPLRETLADSTPPLRAEPLQGSQPPGPVSSLRVSTSIPPTRPSRVAWVAAGLLALMGVGLVVVRTRMIQHETVETAHGSNLGTSTAEHGTHAQTVEHNSAPIPTLNTNPSVAVDHPHQATPGDEVPTDHLLANTADAATDQALHQRADHNVRTMPMGARVTRVRRPRTSLSTTPTEAAPPIVLRLNR